jgi:hypothetical protein
MTRAAPPDNPLVGGWTLVEWAAVADDGSRQQPMGDEPFGLLTYSADGTMVGVMGRGGRRRFASDDVTGGTAEERAAAFETCIAYGGSYAVDGDHVIHRVEVSLFPNWVGTEQRRRWELSDDGACLTLTSPALVLGGTTRIQRLVWRRRGTEPDQSPDAAG